MLQGWDASELLQHLLEKRKKAGQEHTQEWLASMTGIGRGTINGYCTGRLDLGMKNCPRIAAALGVSVQDLGAPSGATGQLSLDDRLAALEEKALTVVDLGPVLRVLRLLATGKRSEALRVLTEEVDL